MDDFASWIMGLLAAFFPALGPEPEPIYNGYAEAAFIYVAPAITRRIEKMDVTEGTLVTAGQVLFTMEAARERASLDAALARREVAQANLHNLETGSREQEIEVMRAALEQALADQQLAKSNLDRSQSLYESGIVTPAKVDADRNMVTRADAHVHELQARLQVAELPARDDQIIAAQATLDASVADVAHARSMLDDLTVAAPISGMIESIYFEAGEVAAGGTPVIALLPTDRVKIIFYIPETERMELAPGTKLLLNCDGCLQDIEVQISRLSSDPQYTPPIIYSREERTRLVFRAEAILMQQYGLLPGQPVTLKRLP